MRTKLTASDYQSFVGARAHKPTAAVLDILRRELEATRADNDTLDGTDLHRSQGKAQFINHFLEIFEKAPELAASLQASETTGRPGAFH